MPPVPTRGEIPPPWEEVSAVFFASSLPPPPPPSVSKSGRISCGVTLSAFSSSLRSLRHPSTAMPMAIFITGTPIRTTASAWRWRDIPNSKPVA